MPNQKKWNKYEAAMLVAGFWCVEKKVIEKSAFVSAFSKAMREQAKRNGEVVDDLYRNENGISLQLSSIEKLFFADRWGADPSQMFVEVAFLYSENRAEYNAIYQKA